MIVGALDGMKEAGTFALALIIGSAVIYCLMRLIAWVCSGLFEAER